MLFLASVGGAGAAAERSPAVDPRLPPAAHEFEACLMKEFLEPLQHDALFDDRTDENSSEGSGSALMSFGAEALAKGLSQRGGFGIAEKLIGDFAADARSAAKKVD